MRLGLGLVMTMTLAFGALACDEIMASDPGCRVVGAETAINEHPRYMASCSFNKEDKIKFVLFCGQDDALLRSYEVTLLQPETGASLTLYLVPHRARNLNGARLLEPSGRDFVPFELEGEYQLSMRAVRGCDAKEGKLLPACTLALRQIRLCERPEDCICAPLPPPAPSSSAAAPAAPSGVAAPAPEPQPAPHIQQPSATPPQASSQPPHALPQRAPAT